MSVTARHASPPIPAPPVTLRLVGPPRAPSAPTSREPEWVGRSWHSTARELRRFVRTSWAFTTRPRETARLWADGRFDALNPLAYLLNTVAIIGPWRALWQLILHTNEPLWMDVVWAVAPFAGVVLSGSFLHLLLSLAGGKRKITSTWAISIYATGGFVAAFGLVSTPFVLLSDHIKSNQDWHDHWLAYALGQAFAYPPFVWQTLALAGLHGLRARRVVFTQLLGILVLGTMFLVVGFQVFVAVMKFTHHRH